MNKIEALQQLENYFDCKDSLIVGLWSSAIVFYPAVELAIFKLEDDSIIRVFCHYESINYSGEPNHVRNLNIISHNALLRLIPLLN